MTEIKFVKEWKPMNLQSIELLRSGCGIRRSYGLYFILVNLGFAALSIPFLFSVTKQSVFRNNVIFQPPGLFLPQHSPLFSETVFTTCCVLLVILCIYSALFVAGRLIDFSKLILTFVVSGFYMSFWYFGTDLYANGTSLPLLVFGLTMLIFPSKKRLLRSHEPVDERPLQFAALAVVAMFFASGLSKISVLGFAWASTDNIQNILLYRFLFVGSETSLAMASSKVISGLIGWAVLLFELLGGLLLLVMKRGSLIYGLCAMTFLLGTWLILGIDEFISLFLPFILVFFLPSHSLSSWRRIFLMESRISERK